MADILHRFTIDCADMALHALRRNLSRDEQKNAPMQIIPDKENSPMRCPVPNQENQFLIYYPAHSEPYAFQLDGLSKECYILLGTVHEKRSGKVYVPEDHFVIPPEAVYEPYTTDDMALALIILRPANYTLECEQTEKESNSSSEQKDCALKPMYALPGSRPSDTEAPNTRMASR